MPATITMESLSSICDVVGDRTGLWLGPNARRRMEAILSRRIGAGNYRAVSEYYHFLRDDPFGNGELAKLVSLATKRKPRLMNPEVSELVGRFAEARGPHAPTQPTVMTVGAAATDDVYTAAVILSRGGADFTSPAVATAADADLDRLVRGAGGVFTNRAVADVPPRDIEEHFDTLPGGRCRVKPGLRENMRWMFADPFGGWRGLLCSQPCDLIICREFLNRLTFAALEMWADPHDLLSPGGMLICDRRLDLNETFAPGQSGKYWLYAKSQTASPHRPWEGRPVDSRTDAAFIKAMKILEHEDDQQAERSLSDAVRDDPCNASCRVALALLLLRKEAAEQAQEHALAALSLLPHSAHALFACGLTYECLEMLKTAEQFYRKALLVQPSMPAAHRRLAELRAKAPAREEQYVHA